MPEVWHSRCRNVTRLDTSGSATRKPGRISATGASTVVSPWSTRRSTTVAVYALVIEPTWNSESVVTSTPVPLCSTPVASAVTSPSASTASEAPGTRCRRVSSSKRGCQPARSIARATPGSLRRTAAAGRLHTPIQHRWAASWVQLPGSQAVQVTSPRAARRSAAGRDAHADLAAESSFWAGLLRGTVEAEDDWRSVVVDGEWRLVIGCLLLRVAIVPVAVHRPSPDGLLVLAGLRPST